ncbi:MAG: hypothetical protein HYT98_03025 [Candidatus Sungbacteria bacterium]|nr:hypothetical protein [Candidatus Sungbacteria bacterium]
MAGKKKDPLKYMSESEALKRAHACVKDMVQKLERLNEKPFSKKERRLLLQKLQDVTLRYLDKHFVVVVDTDDRVRKNPR